MARVALATCAKFPQLTALGEELGLKALQERGITVEPAVWDDPQVRWNNYDLVIVRSTWDYPARRDEFLGWAASVEQLANPLSVLRWNTDKRYLLDMAAAGIPIVPTTIVEPGQELVLPEFGEFVIKPIVGSRTVDTGRFDSAFDQQRELALAHGESLLDAGMSVLVQPYQGRVDVYGETNLVFLAGTFSHAVRKSAVLDRALGTVPAPREIRSSRRIPLDVEYQLADAAAVALRDVLGEDLAEQLLYARFDMVPGIDGLPLLMEVELTEPALFLGSDVLAPKRFADAVQARLERGQLNSPQTLGKAAVGRVPAPRSALSVGAISANG